MLIEDPEFQSFVGFILFVGSALWAVFGNLTLTRKLANMGVRIPLVLQGMTFILYPFYRPDENPEETDRVALSVVAAGVVLVVTVFFLGDYMWPDS